MREFIVTLTVERALKAQATAIYFSHPETLTENLLMTCTLKLKFGFTSLMVRFNFKMSVIKSLRRC